MNKKTKRRIRQIIMFARGVFLVLFGILIALSAISMSGASVLATLVLFASALVCFGVSMFCDYLLGGYKSPFYY